MDEDMAPRRSRPRTVGWLLAVMRAAERQLLDEPVESPRFYELASRMVSLERELRDVEGDSLRGAIEADLTGGPG